MIRDTQLYAFDTKDRSGRQKFVDIYRNLRAWAEANGVIGHKFGYLNSDTLIWMAHGVCISIVKGAPVSETVIRVSDAMLALRSVSCI